MLKNKTVIDLIKPYEKTLIFEYIRNNKGEPQGVIVALKTYNYFKEKEDVVFGWSLCKTKLDKFNKVWGLELAIKRAELGRKYKYPTVIQSKLQPFEERARKYFRCNA